MDLEILVFTRARIDPKLLVFTRPRMNSKRQVQTGSNTKARITSCIELRLKLTFIWDINMSK